MISSLSRLEAIETIANVANSLDIPFFIIGALARDLILSNGYDIATIRATLEILHKETGEQDRYRLIEDMTKSDTGMIQDFKTMLDLLEELKAGILERS